LAVRQEFFMHLTKTVKQDMIGQRRALESVVTRRTESGTEEIAAEDRSESTAITQHFVGDYPQKSPHSGISEGHRGVYKTRKYKKTIGSSGRTRTYNPSVNSRMLCH
jgi:hypothetical protein